MPAMSPARMGLPVDRLVVATNVNDILARTFATGTYEIRDVVATTSPSMDIQVSSNFERLLFDAYWPRRSVGAHADGLARAIAPLRGVGAGAQGNAHAVHRRSRRRAGVRRRNSRLDDERPIIASIRIPAVALAVAEKETRDPSVPMVVLSTAHPAKFPDAVKAACGVEPRRCQIGWPICRSGRSASPCCRPIRQQLNGL